MIHYILLSTNFFLKKVQFSFAMHKVQKQLLKSIFSFLSEHITEAEQQTKQWKS